MLIPMSNTSSFIIKMLRQDKVVTKVLHPVGDYNYLSHINSVCDIILTPMDVGGSYYKSLQFGNLIKNAAHHRNVKIERSISGVLPREILRCINSTGSVYDFQTS